MRRGSSGLVHLCWGGQNERETEQFQQNTYNDAAKKASCAAPTAPAVLQLCSARWEALFQLRFSLLRTWFCHAVLCQGIPIILSSPLYVNCVVKIMQAGTERCWLEYSLNCGEGCCLTVFLFDIQQVTVSSTHGSVLQRVHRGKVSGDDATHGALLKVLLPQLGSVLVWPGCLTLAYKQTGAHTKHLNHFSLLYLWDRPRECSNTRANPHRSGRNSGERFRRISKKIF